MLTHEKNMIQFKLTVKKVHKYLKKKILMKILSMSHKCFCSQILIDFWKTLIIFYSPNGLFM